MQKKAKKKKKKIQQKISKEIKMLSLQYLLVKKPKTFNYPCLKRDD